MFKPFSSLLLPLFFLITSPCFSDTQGSSNTWLNGWQPTQSLKITRAGAAAVIWGRHIYIIGGINGKDFLRSVEKATIRADGALSPWEFENSLLQARGFFSAAIMNNFVYVVGGGNGPSGKNLLKSMEAAKILPNGKLGPWQAVNQTLNYPRRCVKLAVLDDQLFSLGGFSGSLQDTVEVTRLLPGGQFSPWLLHQNQMTVPRYVNATQTIDHTIYVIGGHKETEGIGLTSVEFAKLDEKQSLSKWQQTKPLNTGRYALASATQNNYLYAIGGLEGAIYSDVIEKTKRLENDTLSDWSYTTKLSSPRANSSVITFGNFIYIIGGTNRDGYFRSVEYATINKMGDIGFWASPEKLKTYQLNEKSKPKKVALLPNKGEITQIIHTQAYSYIQLKNKVDLLWIAAPKTLYKIGDNIRYSRGVNMSGFHSRALNRDFDNIRFVENTQLE